MMHFLAPLVGMTPFFLHLNFLQGSSYGWVDLYLIVREVPRGVAQATGHQHQQQHASVTKCVHYFILSFSK